MEPDLDPRHLETDHGSGSWKMIWILPDPDPIHLGTDPGSGSWKIIWIHTDPVHWFDDKQLRYSPSYHIFSPSISIGDWEEEIGRGKCQLYLLFSQKNN